MGEELANTERCTKNAKSKSNSPVLVNSKEEQAIDQDTPDGNVGKDACWQAVSIDSDSSIGVQGNEGPCEWSRNSRSMNQSMVCVVTEVCGREVEEVDDKENLSPPEMGANEEQDESEVEEVVQNEVASNAGRSLDICIVVGEEVPDITELEEVENGPVDWSDNCIQ